MPKRPESIAMLPKTVPVFPLSGALLLPHTNRPLSIFEPRYLAMIDHILGGDRLLALVQPEETGVESPKGKGIPLRRVGSLGRLIHFEETDDNRYLIILEGICRVDLTGEVEIDTPFRLFDIDASSYATDFDATYGESEIDRERFMSMIQRYADFANLDIDWDEIEQTGTADLVNLSCMLTPYGPAEKQMLLEANSLFARAESLIALIEMDLARSQTGHVLQ